MEHTFQSKRIIFKNAQFQFRTANCLSEIQRFLKTKCEEPVNEMFISGQLLLLKLKFSIKSVILTFFSGQRNNFSSVAKFDESTNF
jgi:hypothetical protein